MNIGKSKLISAIIGAGLIIAIGLGVGLGAGLSSSNSTSNFKFTFVATNKILDKYLNNDSSYSNITFENSIVTEFQCGANPEYDRYYLETDKITEQNNIWITTYITPPEEPNTIIFTISTSGVDIGS